MTSNKKVIFYVQHNNDIDQATPIIYKLARESDFIVDIIIYDTSISASDYRLDFLSEFECVEIWKHDQIYQVEDDNNSNLTKRYFETLGGSLYEYGYKIVDNDLVKSMGKSLPTDIPKQLYDKYILSETDYDNKLPFVDNLAEGFDDVIVAVDWSVAKLHDLECLTKKGYTSVVYPHGDRPYWNIVNRRSRFEEVMQNKAIFQDESEWVKTNNEPFKHLDDADYFLMPNKKSAQKAVPYINNEKIKILGSPRYNEEWLEVLPDIRPTNSPDQEFETKIVIFSRNERFFISKEEVRDTIRLTAGFPHCHVIFKEHPREPLLTPDSFKNIDNLDVVVDEYSSASLIEWGDIFLELGTSIAFEPVMKHYPVLSINYAHSNENTISHFISQSNIKSKEELYYKLHELLNSKEKFYDENEWLQFKEEMVTNGNPSVLSEYVSFFKNLCE